MKSTCKFLAEKKPCELFQKGCAGVMENGYRVSCPFGHDFPRERRLLADAMVSHMDTCWRTKTNYALVVLGIDLGDRP